MLETERKWLPQFEGKEIRPTPTICIPPGCRAAEVPLDPALAINKRFATLIEQKTE
jgi:alpha-galactosidase